MSPKGELADTKSTGAPIALPELISELHKVFESDHVNIEYVDSLMQNYKSDNVDWTQFADFQEHSYTRNLVDTGNGKFNLILVCWGGGHTSPVHDHADSHCFMKTINGCLTEVRYAWPDTDTSTTEGQSQGLEETSRIKLDTNFVSYMNDTLGLHSVENASKTDRAVSLHLYCPPINTCSLFEKNTGHRTKCQVTFWSKHEGKNSYINMSNNEKGVVETVK